MVRVEGVDELCYVASSSHLSHFIDLKNKNVLLKKNVSNNSRMEYTLFAVSYKRTKVLLELSYINKLIMNYLIENHQDEYSSDVVKREQKFANGYKADIVIYKPEKTIIIEAKSILTLNNEAEFPKNISRRAIEQLVKIKELLIQGYEVFYWLVLLNPKCETVSLLKNNNEFYSIFQKCITLGMKVMLSKLSWLNEDGFFIKSSKFIELN